MDDSDRNSSIEKTSAGGKFAKNHSASLSDGPISVFAIYGMIPVLWFGLLFLFGQFRFLRGGENPFEAHRAVMKASRLAFGVAAITLLLLLQHTFFQWQRSVFGKSKSKSAPVVDIIMKIVFSFAIGFANIFMLVAVA